MAQKPKSREVELRWKVYEAYAEKVADRLLDLGNITFGALILGQFSPRKAFNGVSLSLAWVCGYGFMG